jgi:peptidoglycan/LPS O-acetylase OafA/YrhL
MANGAWSIGNELFFYAFFPILFFLGRARKLWLYLAVAIIFIPFVVFAFKLIDPSIRLGHQWSKYTNPLNQFFFFAIGVLIASLVKPDKPWTKIAPLLVLVLFVPVIFYPAAGEPVVLVTGLNRMALSALTILICYFFYISDFAFLPAIFRRFLKFLGDASFSIYLLHPLIHQIIHNIAKNLNIDLPPYLLITLTVLSTLITSYFVYNRFEKYFMKLGKNYIKKRRSNLVVSG